MNVEELGLTGAVIYSNQLQREKVNEISDHFMAPRAEHEDISLKKHKLPEHLRQIMYLLVDDVDYECAEGVRNVKTFKAHSRSERDSHKFEESLTVVHSSWRR